MASLKQALLASSISFVLCVQSAFAQTLCHPSPSGIELNFDISPSLVVNSDAVLDETMAASGSSERVFSFRRTVAAILRSAEFPDGPPAEERFVQTLLDTFAPSDGFELNRNAGVLMPIDGRQGERSKLTAAGLLDEQSETGLVPLALFNRFDLAPADWSHCGEHRIVYGKRNPGFTSRFLLIFEAAVENPGQGETGCRPIAEFWAGLSQVAPDSKALTERLSKFYYEGVIETAGGSVKLKNPVVHYENYGGGGVSKRGKVRGNIFMQTPWQLREWLTQPIFDPDVPLAFVAETVKDNPLAELYRDDFVSMLSNQNFPAALTNLHGEFAREMTSRMRDNLLSEGTEKYRDLLEDLPKYALGASPDAQVTEPTILKNTIALGNDRQFDEFQSTAAAQVDEPAAHAQTNMRRLLAAALAQPVPHLQPQSVDTLLTRAAAATCAGCHQTAPGQTIRVENGQVVAFPPQHAGGFVHVAEGRTLSDALKLDFLPYRRYVMGRYLCPVNEPAQPLAASSPALTARPQALSIDMAQEFLRARSSSPSGASAAPSSPSATASPASAIARATAELGEADRNTLRRRLHDAIANARAEEQRMPGAFIEVRRPH